MSAIKNKINKQIKRSEMFMEDLKMLQKSISGKSVYKPRYKAYRRAAKYGKLEYEHYR
jgi:hypothetical protein